MGFQEMFGCPPQASAQAPGRVNLLGEHTDYNEGFVLPTPIPYFTQVETAEAQGVVEAYSERFQERQTRPISKGRQGGWLDYIVGCVWALRQGGWRVPGGRFYIQSTVPLGAGLASSAALEVAVLRALRALYALSLGDVELAQLAQQAEVEYVGVRCGIMDQMAAALGVLGQALFLDTRSLKYEQVPLPKGYRVAVVDSGVPRNLAGSSYNERRRQCEEAAHLLGIRSLRELSLNDLPLLKGLPPPLDRRVRHVVTENARVLEGMQALRAGDVETFGRLMQESHRSLREDYEVSTPKLDALVELALCHGAVGARLTGAGFGGAIVALVPEDMYAEWARRVTEDFPQATIY